MKLIDLLNKTQMELELSNGEFAKYIGTSRTWWVNMKYHDNYGRPISKKTGFKLKNRIKVTDELIDEYNKGRTK